MAKNRIPPGNETESGTTGPHVLPCGNLTCSQHIYHDETLDSLKYSVDGLGIEIQQNTCTQYELESTNAHVDFKNECTTGPEPSITTYESLQNSQHTAGSTGSPPHDPAHREHLHKTRQYYRDMMLGVNDGLVSTLLLVAGVVGGGMNVPAVFLTAVAGAIAGAISMFAGEYVATKSQNEVMNGEIELEREHVEKYNSDEMQQLPGLLSLIGIPSSSPALNHKSNDPDKTQTSQEDLQELIHLITDYYRTNPDALLKIMIALELGVIDDEVRSPFVAGAASFFCFFVGALPSTIPFAIVSDPRVGLLAAGIATCLGLSLVGVVKSWATRGNFLLSALENLSITAAGGAVAYGIGVGFQCLLGDEV
ncbi:hypothetical protein ACHAW6_008138 [Cyclotella cf. meneghiniana]